MEQMIFELIKADINDLDYQLRKLYQKPLEQRTTSDEELISFFYGARWALEQLIRQVEEAK